MSAKPAATRFDALDSVRGVCALTVALFHLDLASNAHFWPFFGGGWLFVDFFFVIAWSYGNRLAGGYRVGDFLALRIGRVYPLHLVVLAAMVMFELLGLLLDHYGILHRDSFSGTRSVPALFGSLAMVQIFGLWDQMVWNGPSWSIAAELWTYLIFALVCHSSGARFAMVMGFLAAISLVWLLVEGEAVGRSGSALPRCVYAFGLGVLIARYRNTLRLPGGVLTATLIELAVVMATVLLVSIESPPVRVAPLLFALAVWVFSFERGLVSQVLLCRPLRWLGMVSYSIYMIHFVVLLRLGDLAAVLEKRLHHPLLEPCLASHRPDCFIMRGIEGPVVTATFVAVLLVGAWIAYRVVEQPCRNWSRDWVKSASERRAATFANDHAAF